jgi:LysR family glycine cleavage system transcriptional activator
VPFDFWGEWLRSVGLADYSPKRVKTYDNAQIIFEAAAAGLGLSLGAQALVDSYTQSGRLVPAFSTRRVESRFAYYLVYRARDRNWAPLRALRSMLLASTDKSPKRI